jgi:hypothetical protein
VDRGKGSHARQGQQTRGHERKDLWQVPHFSLIIIGSGSGNLVVRVSPLTLKHAPVLRALEGRLRGYRAVSRKRAGGRAL